MYKIEKLIDFAKLVAKAGGRAYYVGGYVRDAILNVTPNDIDVVVRRLTLQHIQDIAVKVGLDVELGNQNRYPVLFSSCNNRPYGQMALEITIPRASDSSMQFTPNPDASLYDDAQRRDLTINAIYQDILTDEIIDPVSGFDHLLVGMLYPVSNLFMEDPQRVLRAFSTISLYNLRASNELVDVCSVIADKYSTVPNEIIGKHLYRACSGTNITAAIQFLKETGWLKIFPWLYEQDGFDQQSQYHDECLLDHSIMVAQHAQDNYASFNIVIAALMHDIGKLSTKTVNDSGTAHYYQHDKVGADLARQILSSYAFNKKDINEIVELIRNHMVFALHPDKVTSRMVRRLVNRLQYTSLNNLVFLHQIDCQGRIPSQGSATSSKVYKIYQQLLAENENTFEPLLTGNDVLSAGVSQGPEVGTILDEAQKLQENGLIKTRHDAQKWLKQRLAGDSPRVRLYLPFTENEIILILEMMGIDATQQRIATFKERLRSLIYEDIEYYIDKASSITKVEFTSQ